MTRFVKTAVIGHPVAHSKSPLIHRHWMDAYGLSGSYEAVDIAPEDLERGIKGMCDQGVTGFNVTVPHKVAVMTLCDTLDDLARMIGAVNTVTVKDGRLHGTNTDAFGFAQNIVQYCERQGWSDWSFDTGKAIVLGAGGAANAVIHALLDKGAPEIIVLNRTRDKAQALCAMNPDKVSAGFWDARVSALSGANLIVNTTTLGMAGAPPLDLDLTSVSEEALVCDIVYAPLQTDLLQRAAERGLRTVTGIGMLLHQARPGFQLWHGVLPEVTPELERLVLR